MATARTAELQRQTNIGAILNSEEFDALDKIFEKLSYDDPHIDLQIMCHLLDGWQTSGVSQLNVINSGKELRGIITTASALRKNISGRVWKQYPNWAYSEFLIFKDGRWARDKGAPD
jgi:hypothetical protein